MTVRMMKNALLLLFLIACFPANTHAMRNPAAVYCKALGYEYVVEEEDEGQRGLCVLPGGQEVDGWEFLEGKAAPEFGYCQEQGFEMKTVTNPRCASPSDQECAVCILDDGTEVEVTELMGLRFTEHYCGDGSCHFSEFYATCPEDLPSGQQDDFCDEVIDGTCDPDCSEDSDADCAGADIDADGICNGPDSIEYPNCRYGDVEGVCKHHEELMAACGSCRACRTVNHLCTAAGMKKAVSPVLKRLMSALRKKQLITALRQIIASGSVLTASGVLLVLTTAPRFIILTRLTSIVMALVMPVLLIQQLQSHHHFAQQKKFTESIQKKQNY